MKPPYEYRVQLPADYDPGKSYPVLFTLHGKGSNEQDLLSLMSAAGDSFLLIGIRGDLPAGMGYQYYELQSIGNPVRSQFDQAVSKLEAFMDWAETQYSIDRSRRYVAGFSQGAILALTLAHTRGDKLKGIIALNGYVPGFVKTDYPVGPHPERVSAFVSHGQFDQVFPAAIGDETAAYMKTLTDHVTYRTYPSGHTVTEANRRDLLQWLEQDRVSSAI
ncbi:alpha/beta hydrolase-fold protein [Gorillibacterium sp. CAU 1737]|uniref:alpha/beta hydrolase n=1 Tax=Gorillibacterium sp. CAU 1737 TaxID=3140362 RepID=UPI003261B0E8